LPARGLPADEVGFPLKEGRPSFRIGKQGPDVSPDRVNAPAELSVRAEHCATTATLESKRSQDMARANPVRTNDAPRDAVQLLKQDHRNVEALVAAFEDADDDEVSSLAENICNMLRVHAQIEEEILYPAAKEALSEDEEEAELVSEAEVEHASAKELIAKIEGMTPDHEAFKATVKVLGEYVKHHVKEEENELFPALKESELDLKAIGARLAERKYELMEEMGLEEPEIPTQRKRSTGSRSRSASRGRQAPAGARSKSARSSGRAARH
jgi:hemerythrin superfamily protein